MNIIGGKLKFKSAFEDKLSLQKKVLQNKLAARQEKEDNDLIKLATMDSEGPVEKIIEHPQRPGTGRILTSGVVVHGKDTIFNKELKRGDFIIFIDGTRAGETERRQVNLVYSDKSLSITEPFSRDIITYSQFDIQPQNTVTSVVASTEQLYHEKLAEIERPEEEKETIVEIKKKSGMWGYKTERIKIKGDVTREDMVKMRAQAKKDKWS